MRGTATDKSAPATTHSTQMLRKLDDIDLQQMLLFKLATLRSTLASIKQEGASVAAAIS